MRILVLTPWYYPFVHPRAYRWTHVAGRWAAWGHEVHVVCARQRGFAALQQHEGVWVHRVGFDSLKEVFFYWANSPQARGRIGAGTERPSAALRMLSAAYRRVWKNLCFPDDAWQWYWPALQMAEALHRQHPFEMVVSVSLPFTTHLVGRAFKRRHPEVRWLADIGDPYSLHPGPLQNPLYSLLGRRFERAVLTEADAVALTNPGLAEAYARRLGVPAERFAVVPPLWNDDATALEEETPWIEKYWHIGYFGTFYAPIRTPHALADLIRRTFAQRPEWRARLFFHFYGEVFPEFWNLLYALPNTTLHGLCSPAQAQRHMRRMRALLSVGNTTPWQLPSKAVSYLAAGRPVAHLSFIEDDALVRFWADRPHLLVLPVRQGQVTAEGFQHWLDFLEKTPPALSEAERQQLAAPFRTEAIAEAYLRLLVSSKKA
ncbi:MAG: glycosyltransferase [Saprospiraceae bacterium]|nr:glycosyltransferase [Saprospiraceae bacterium]MDW8485193.1 glycosyltransferase [Saprospiraceae bacterium]